MATLQTLRRAGQDALNDRLRATVYAPSADSSTILLLELVSSATNQSAGRYDGKWLYYLPAAGGAAGQQRIVKNGSYVASLGSLGVEVAFLTAPSFGDTAEITGLFPPNAPVLAGETSYTALINATLRQLVIPDRYEATMGVSGSVVLPSWLREDRLRGVLEPGPTGGIAVDAAWRRPRLVADAQGNRLTLDVPYAGTAYLDVLRPADTVIAPASTGVYADSTVGLLSEGDQAKVEVGEFVEVFKMVAYEVLMNRGDDARWTQRFKEQVPIARAQPHFDRSAQSTAASSVPERAAA